MPSLIPHFTGAIHCSERASQTCSDVNSYAPGVTPKPSALSRITKSIFSSKESKPKAVYPTAESRQTGVPDSRFSQPVKPAAVASANPPNPASLATPKSQLTEKCQDALVDSKGKCVVQNVRNFSDALRRELKQCETIIFNSPASFCPTLRDVLTKRISLINQKIDCLYNIDSSSAENVHQYARDLFEEISDLAEGTVSKFSLKDRPKSDGTVPGGPANTVGQISLFFSNLQKFANELKRHHFTHAAHLRIESYVDREMEQIVRYCPGLAKARRGSEVRHSWEGGVSLMAGPALGGLAKFGPSLSYKFLKDKRMWVDHDGEINIESSTTHTGKASIIGKIGSMLTLSAGAYVSTTKGDYCDNKTLREVLRTEVLRQSDKWNKVHVSGNENSTGKKAWQGLESGVRSVARAAGVAHVPTGAMPVISQRKLEKGYENTDKIIAYAERLTLSLPGVSQGTESLSLKEITAQAYPAIGKRFSDFELPKPGEKHVEAKPQSTLVLNRPIPSPCGGAPLGEKKSHKTIAGGGELRADFNTLQGLSTEGGQVHSLASAKLAYDYTEKSSSFFRAKPVYEQLDPGYTKSYDQCATLLEQLKAACVDKNKTFKTHSLSKIEEVLLGDRYTRSTNSISLPIKQKNQAEAIQQIRSQYSTLMDVSRRLTSFQDKKYREEFKTEYQTLLTDLGKFCSDVFGIKNNDRPRGETQINEQAIFEKFKKDPHFFITESYDSLSISLGKIGLNIFENKLATRDHLRTSGYNKETLLSQQRNVDISYTSLRNMMDGVYLPIDKETLLRGASLQARSKGHRCSSSISGGAGAGINTTPLSYIPGNGLSPELLSTHPDLAGHGQIITSTAGVGFSVVTSEHQIDAHPNPARDGLMYNFEIGLESIGAAIAPLKPLLRTALNSLKMKNTLIMNTIFGRKTNLPANNAILPSPESIKKIEIGVDNCWDYLVRSGLAGSSCEFQKQIQLKAPPAMGNRTYEFSMQFIRFVEKTTDRRKIAGGLSGLAGPVQISGSASLAMTNIAGTVAMEIMGTSPSHHILSFNDIGDVIAKSTNDKVLASGRVAGPLNLDECDFSKMQALFRGEAVAGSGAIDARFLLNKMFAIDDSVMGFLEKFANYYPHRRKMGLYSTLSELGTDQNGERARSEFSEFDMYDDKPEYWKTINSIMSTDHFCPGRGANRPGETEQTDSMFLGDFENDPRPRLTADDVVALKKAKDFFALNKEQMTPEMRMQYFLGNDDGKRLFKLYCQINEKYNYINNSLKSSVTYGSAVSV